MQAVFDVNFFAQVSFSQYMVKAMTKHGGSIVNLSSSAAIEGNEGRVAYAASKSAMISFTKVISRELARHGIRANAIAPGLTQTEMMEQSTPQDALGDHPGTHCHETRRASGGDRQCRVVSRL